MNNKINYETLSEIIVKTQGELNMIPDDFKGRIYIESEATIIVNKKYYWRIVARGNSSVEARGNSSVEARGNSSVVARENSSVVAWGNSSVVAWGNSSVVAWGNSSVVARENSSVVAWGNSSVVASANSQVVDRHINNYGKILISGNARIVYMPKNINEFMDYYGIKHTKTKAVFYKAVRRTSDKNVFKSDYDSNFKYVVGEEKKENCDPNTSCSCSNGIHISHLNWALAFGRDWDDLAIIECETKINDIIMPNDTDGKVRTSKVKVLREVPLEECGAFGKVLAKRLNK